MQPFGPLLASIIPDRMAASIHSGAGSFDSFRSKLPAGRILLVTSEGFTRRGLTDFIRGQLGERLQVYDRVTPNPELTALDRLTSQYAEDSIDGILAAGGGSVLDTAKTLSLTIPCGKNDPLTRLFRNGETISWENPLPWVAAPTTAGTGAEATPFATVWDSFSGKKNSLADPLMLPSDILLDPELTKSLPRFETLYTGLDAISHALESLWNRRRTETSRLAAEEALERAVNALPKLLESPGSLPLRSMMQEASFLAGVAISQTRTAVAHAMSYPLTLRFGMPHGLACGFTLGAILKHCIESAVDLGIPRQRVDDVFALLTELAIDPVALKYASPSQMQALRSIMHTPGRSDNFILPVNDAVLQHLIDTATSRQ